MSIEQTGSTYSLYCDICGDEADEIFYDFQDAVNHKKANGWQSKNEYGEWFDVCPKCQEGE